jgi:succinate dehydrogenase flavin-adding protein (antitoxin of CptAB toxin-antitoxin module)
MAGKSSMQKTLTFRLNLSHAEEKELYDAIKGHDRSNAEDSYGSSGAYIKAALKHFHGRERQYQLQERLQEFIQEQMEKQTKTFLSVLEEHDKRLVELVVKTVMEGKAESKLSDFANTVSSDVAKSEWEDIPEEAMDYLASL